MRLLLLSFLFFYACSPGLNKREEPENLIPKKNMISIVQEMVVMEAHIQSKIPSVSKYHKVMTNSGDSILSIHNVSRVQYESSLEFYAKNQIDLQEIYDEALDDLNKEQAVIESSKKN